MTRFAAFWATILLGLTGCGHGPARSAEPVPTGDVRGEGRFTGASGHTTSGAVRIVEHPDGRSLVFGADFAFDGAPDPVVGFGDGAWVPASKLGPLQATGGTQTYPLPPGFAHEGYTQVYVWCERFAVPLGVAELTRP